ncbi:MAG: hypothetical protein JW841_17680 [Deltaproteobacteria bacterium]|nr:hypothetical protein [Deltaproteobacteria bacterium]
MNKIKKHFIICRRIIIFGSWLRLCVYIMCCVSWLITSSANAATNEKPIWGFSIATGPYQPEMGKNKAYYRRIYAAKSNSSLFKHRPLMTTFTANWYILDTFGLLGLYGQFGYWKVSAPTRICNATDPNDATQTVVVACQPEDILARRSVEGTDQTELSIYPLSVGVNYKFDLLMREFALPLMPYTKGGIDYFLWRNTTGGHVSYYHGKQGYGGTLGAQAALGLMLNLDWIEPSAAKHARSSTGVVASYIFFEARRLFADGFGNEKKLDLSATHLQVGLALDLN